VLPKHNIDLDIIIDLFDTDAGSIGVSLGQHKRLLRAIPTLGAGYS